MNWLVGFPNNQLHDTWCPGCGIFTVCFLLVRICRFQDHYHCRLWMLMLVTIKGDKSRLLPSVDLIADQLI